MTRLARDLGVSRDELVRALLALPLVVLLAAALAAAGSQGGATVGGVPVFAVAVGVAFIIQWLVLVPSYLARTERFFDLTGSLTYITDDRSAACQRLGRPPGASRRPRAGLGRPSGSLPVRAGEPQWRR